MEKMKICTAAIFYIYITAVTCKPTDSDLEDTYGITDDGIQNDNNNDYGDAYEEEDDDVATENDAKVLAIYTQDQQFTKNIGDNVELPCNISGNDPVQMWKKDANILFQGAITLAAKTNMKILSNGALRITNLNESDEGIYECTAVFDESNHKSIKHSLKLNKGPKVERIEIKDNKDVLKTGDTLLLKCIASGTPKPNISWHKNSERLGVEGDILTIENVKHHNAGTYRCLADNKIGKPDHAQVTIKVEFKPIVTIEKISVSSDENMSTELKCIVHSEPRAQVVWKKDHKNIVTSENTELATHGDHHILILKNLQESDFGDYTCSAVNYIGETKRSLKLVKTPAILRFIKPHTDSKDVVLTWEVQSKSPVYKHELGYRKRGETEWKIINPEIGEAKNELYTVKYMLNDLEPGIYETRIRSKNNNGWSEYSDIMPFEGVISQNGHQHNKHKKNHHKEKHTPSSEAVTTKSSQNELPPAEHNEIDTKDSATLGASEINASWCPTPSTTLLFSIVLGYSVIRL